VVPVTMGPRVRPNPVEDRGRSRYGYQTIVADAPVVPVTMGPYRPPVVVGTRRGRYGFTSDQPISRRGE
jgi:hypothetical protein